MKDILVSIRYTNHDRGAALISAIVVMLVVSVLAGIAVTTTTSDLRLSSKYHGETKALYIAEAGLQRALIVLKSKRFQEALDGPDGQKGNTPKDADNGYLADAGGSGGTDFGGGKYIVRVTDSEAGWTDTDGRITITSTGTVGSSSKVVTALVERELPPGIKGAVTTNGGASPAGQATFDGRNHDIDGNYINNSKNGVKGMASFYNYDGHGQAKVGGTGGGADVAPSTSPPGSILQKDTPWDPIQWTAEEAVELTATTFKNLAIAGSPTAPAGSRYYSTAPSASTSIRGITYIEDDGYDYERTDGEGILVVHKTGNTGDITIKSGSVFRGIIITDRVTKIHGKVIGAVIALDATEMSQLATGQGEVDFSRAALECLTSIGVLKSRVLTWHD